MRKLVPAGAILALLAVFAALGWRAAGRQSITYDETVHLAAAWAYVTQHDLRINPEHPPLWKIWAGLPLAGQAVHADLASPLWQGMLGDVRNEWYWSVSTLYRSSNDADALAARARAMMLIVGVGLGAMLAAWAWRLGGPVAGCIAAALFCFDPNFLAHAPLVTNDVAVTLGYLAMAWIIWRLGRRVTRIGLIAAGVILGICLCIKFTAIFLLPTILLLLLIRAVQTDAWLVMGHPWRTRRSRLAAVAVLLLLIGILAYGTIWVSYGWRFSPTPDGRGHFNPQPMLNAAADAELQQLHPDRAVTPAERAAWQPGLTPRAILWATAHRLLPESWLTGLLFQYANTRSHAAFLLGTIYPKGRWYYFPLAMLFKTPLATLLAILAASAVVVGRCRGGWRFTWNAWVLVIPAAVYLAIAMTNGMNLGQRHVLPVYPFIYIGVGWVAAHLFRQAKSRRQLGILGGVLLAGLAGETLLAYPRFIPFFNVASGGEANGVNLLGDSNLDWGQDLKTLAAWQRTHAQYPLYLCYMGTADPAYYHIHYLNVAGGYLFGPPPQPIRPPCLIAISLTNYQGIYYHADRRREYAFLHEIQPLAKLGSIYLFADPPTLPMMPAAEPVR